MLVSEAPITSTPLRSRPSAPAAVVLLAAFVVVALFQAYRVSSNTAGIDFYQFWETGRSVVGENRHDLYSATGRAALGAEGLSRALASGDPQRIAAGNSRRVFETYSTPFLYVVFGSVCGSDYASDLSRYRVVLLGCFVVSVTMLAYLLKHDAATILAALGFLLIGFEPLASELRVGNVNCLQLFGVSVYAFLCLKWRHRYRELVAGVWMGLLIAFKPNLVVIAAAVLLLLLLDKRWRSSQLQATGLALGLGAAVLVSALQYGSIRCWLDFWVSLRELPDDIILVQQGNFALSKLTTQWFALSEGSWSLGIVGVIGCVTLALRRWVSLAALNSSVETEPRRVVVFLSLGCLGLVLLTRLAWLHYFVFAVPALLAVLPRREDPRPRWQKLIDLALVAVVWLALGSNPLVYLGQRHTMVALGTVIVLATLLLLLRLLLEVRLLNHFVLSTPCRNRERR